jgi:hypothetical protein
MHLNPEKCMHACMHASHIPLYTCIRSLLLKSRKNMTEKRRNVGKLLEGSNPFLTDK